MTTVKLTKDEEYYKIVNFILKHKDFRRLNQYHHHGTSRLLHSYRVSYYAYLVAKKLRLDYKKVAIAGLLHDFYFDNNKEGKLYNFYHHPFWAVKNAETYFLVCPEIKSMIRTHMFPWTFKPPQSLAGWVLNIVDKGVALYEFNLKFKYKFALWFVFLLNLN